MEFSMENVWFVGDTDNDLACAQSAGAISVLIAEKEPYIRLSKDYKIDLYCHNCKELHDFLLQYNGKPLKLTANSE
jgi:phosphoglycolate phosphatase-like HAD superfamily hydrolase